LGRIFAALLLSCTHCAAADGDLSGLWKATARFGPDARGPLILYKTGDGWLADFIGRTHPVAVDGADLELHLAGDGGDFRARLRQDGTITGQWIARSTVHGARYAFPVVLRPDGVNRWQGTVAPWLDDMTLYLKVDKRPDGTLGAFIRNPERNIGVFFEIDRVELDPTQSVRLVGHRRGSKEQRVLYSGRYDAGSDVITLFMEDPGPSVDFHRDTNPQSGFYARGVTPGKYVYRPPPARDDGWPVGTLEEAGIDRAALERMVQSLVERPVQDVHTPMVEGILIARRGKLVFEEYFHEASRDKLHETRSAAKSMTATTIGAAMHAGAPLDLKSAVYAVMNGGTFPAGVDPRKRDMTLEHLMTMRGGFFCDDSNDEAPGNEDKMQEQTAEPDWYKYSLRVPQATAPGTESVYCSMMPNLALGMVGRAMDEPVLDIFDRLVAAPLGIATYAWFLDRAGHPYGGGGAHFLPRDFMKMGQLMLDGGTWHGRRILSREFAERAVSPLHKFGKQEYGYLWWVRTYPYKDRTVRAYYAGGNGGQIVMVIPELDLVLASYGANYADRSTFFFQQDVVPKDVLPAVK